MDLSACYIVYLLVNTGNNYTYLGITNNSKNRLRKHNGELVGGARYTKNFKGTGIWKYYLQIHNLTKSQALSIERKVKNRRHHAKGKTSLEKRIYCIDQTLKEYNDITYVLL